MCDSCDWERFAGIGEDMMDNPKYEFALETIEGITNWIQANQHVTDKQKAALLSIKNSVSGGF